MDDINKLIMAVRHVLASRLEHAFEELNKFCRIYNNTLPGGVKSVSIRIEKTFSTDEYKVCCDDSGNFQIKKRDTHDKL